MTAVSSLVFPGGRVLAGWSRQLASLQPAQLWVGHLLLHRVEALVCVARPCRPDPLSLLVLRALRLAGTLAALEEHMRLGPQFLVQLLRDLQAQRLVEAADGGAWRLTPAGEQAVHQGEYPRPHPERRVFHFLESSRPGHPPPFVRLNRPAGQACPPPAGWHFDAEHLAACLHRPPEWKQRHGFALDVDRLVLPSAGSADWQSVVLDRPEHLLAVLAHVLSPEGERLLAFEAHADGWQLDAAEPVFSVGADWREVFPDLRDGPGPEAWLQAWRGWCQARRLPPAEADACDLEPSPRVLRVHAGKRLMDRLRATRSEALKGETWLLAGAGPVRAAAVLDIKERD
jgi:hypothetical protein